MFRFTLSVYSLVHPNTVYTIHRIGGDQGLVRQNHRVYSDTVEIDKPEEGAEGFKLYKVPLEYLIKDSGLVIARIMVIGETNAVQDSAIWTATIKSDYGDPVLTNNDANPNKGALIEPDIIAGSASIQIGREDEIPQKNNLLFLHEQ